MFTEDTETLCNMHATLAYYAKELRKDLKNKKKAIPELDIRGNLELIEEVLKLIRKAKKAGQHMENRLVKTRRAIESLSYRRVFKGEVQSKI